jgi:hypothetical protein
LAYVMQVNARERTTSDLHLLERTTRFELATLTLAK